MGDRGLCRGAAGDALHPVVQEPCGQRRCSPTRGCSAGGSPSRTCSRPFCCGVRAHGGEDLAEPAQDRRGGPTGEVRRLQPRPRAGVAPLPDRLRAPRLRGGALCLRAGGGRLLLRPPARPRRHRAGRGLRRRHQRLLHRALRVLGKRDPSGGARQRRGGRGRRRLRLPDHRQPGLSAPGKGLELQGVRQHPADPQPLLHRLRQVGAARPAARLARHEGHPRPGAKRPAAGEAGSPRRGARRQPRLPALPVGLAAEGGAVAGAGRDLPVRGGPRAHRAARSTRAAVRKLDRPGARRYRRRRRRRRSGDRRPRARRDRQGLPHRRLIFRPRRPAAVHRPLRRGKGGSRRRADLHRPRASPTSGPSPTSIAGASPR